MLHLFTLNQSQICRYPAGRWGRGFLFSKIFIRETYLQNRQCLLGPVCIDGYEAAEMLSPGLVRPLCLPPEKKKKIDGDAICYTQKKKRVFRSFAITYVIVHVRGLFLVAFMQRFRRWLNECFVVRTSLRHRSET